MEVDIESERLNFLRRQLQLWRVFRLLSTAMMILILGGEAAFVFLLGRDITTLAFCLIVVSVLSGFATKKYYRITDVIYASAERL